MRDEGHGAGSLFLSFLVGGIVGAGVALLLAPQSGRETRRKIGEFADGVRDKAEGYVDETREAAKSAVQRGKDYISEKRSILSTAVEAGKEAYERERAKHAKEA